MKKITKYVTESVPWEELLNINENFSHLLFTHLNMDFYDFLRKFLIKKLLTFKFATL